MTQQSDFLMKAADLHLRRAIALADVEWKVTIVFWGALLTSGISFIAFARTSEPLLAIYIAHHDWVFLAAYAAASAIFVFGFSINQAKSIIEERRQYQGCQNTAAEIVRVAPRAKTGGGDQVDDPIRMTENSVWRMKVYTTFLFVSALWVVAQVLAHGRISTSGNAASTAGEISLACAFIDCGGDGSYDSGDCLEAGTVVWLLLFIGVGIVGWKGRSASNR